MNKNPSATANTNYHTGRINRNIVPSLLSAIATVSDDDTDEDETDCRNQRCSLNIIQDLSDSCALEQRNESNLLFPGFVEKAFYCLRQTTILRYQCLKLITCPWFERISMFVILLNCITLGMYQPCAHHTGMEASKRCDTTVCLWLDTIDYFVLGYFTIEMCIKMIAMGIFGTKTYLAESWNRLDCFIVLTGLMELFIPGDLGSLTIIRIVRVLRPLRTVNRIPSMRILITLLFDLLPMLSSVLILCFFVFFVFSIIGVQLWKGLLRNRCFLQLNTTITDNYALSDGFSFESFYTPSDEDWFICSDPSSSGMTKCSEIPQLRQDDVPCELDLHSWSSSFANKAINGCINWHQYYQLCTPSDENPFSGSVHFDNIASAWLAIFQIITLASWSNIMHYVQDAHSFWDWIYFVSLIIIGSFFMMNLCLAVISAQFSVTKKRETERILAEQQRFPQGTSTVKMDEQDSCWKRTITSFRQLPTHICKRVRIFGKHCRQKHDKTNQKDHGQVTTEHSLHLSDPGAILTIPLINHEHQPNCRYYRPQSCLVETSSPILVDSDVNTSRVDSKMVSSTTIDNRLLIKNNREKSTSLEFGQEEQGNVTCNCHNQNEIIKISDNDREENEEILEHHQRQGNTAYCSCFTKIKEPVRRIVDSKYFDRIIFVAIMINTFLMAIEYHGQPQWVTDILEYSNYVFTILFTIEMLCKIIAHGCLAYIHSLFNLFDGGIIVISLIELCGTQNSGLAVLRTFRLLRVLKLVRFMPTLRHQLVVMIKTVDNVATFLLLLILFIFIFTILGMHLFGGEFCTITGFNRTSHKEIDIKCRCCQCIEWHLFRNSTDLKDVKCTEERANFDSFRLALLTVFQILTQEDWNEILYNGMEKTNAWSALYFIVLMVFGNYILLNLLVAILVESFANEKEEAKITNDDSTTNKLNEIEQLETQLMIESKVQSSENFNPPTDIKFTIDNQINRRQNVLTDTAYHANSCPSFISSPSPSTQSYIIHDENLVGNSLNHVTNSCLNSMARFQATIDHSLQLLDKNIMINDDQPSEQQEKTDIIQTDIDIQPTKGDQNNSGELDTLAENNTKSITTVHRPKVIRSSLSCFCGKRKDYSLYLFSPSNRFRRILQKLITQKGFDYFILFFIAFNCVTLAMERPSISSLSFERKFLNYTNYLFTGIFTIEMIIKIIANGLICGSHTYLHSAWNIMDGILVIISLVDLIVTARIHITSVTETDTASHILSGLRVFRLLRALRPLRVINRAPGLKLIVQTLISSLRPIGNTIIICCVFFIIFGILGVQLFKGKFYYCEGPYATNVTTRQQCENMTNHRWQNQQYNFDNLGEALVTLFILSSKDGWVNIMYNGIDAVDVDMQPIKNYSEAKSIYFIAFILIVGFFIVNMFVGVVVESFHECQAKQQIEEEARRKAKHAKEIEHEQCLMREQPYYTNFSWWRKCLHSLCTNKYFEVLIAIAVGLNVAIMSLEFYEMPSAVERFLEYSNYVFTAIFLFEFMIKILALGPLRYFKDKWNQLDSFIVFSSVIGIVIDNVKAKNFLPINPTILRVIRVLRIARVLRLLKMAKGVQALLDTIMQTFPQVGNLSLLFLLVLFIFAALGVELFGKLKCNDEQPCDALGKHMNFRNFGMAFLTLFCVTTGDNWSGIMKDTLRQDDSSGNIKSYFMPIVSRIYFVFFVLICQFILINIVVAVLLKKLEESSKMIDDDNAKTDENTQP